MANNLKESKGVLSQKEIMTGIRCPVCHQLMRQNEIGVEIAFRHARKPGSPSASGSSSTPRTARPPEPARPGRASGCA